MASSAWGACASGGAFEGHQEPRGAEEAQASLLGVEAAGSRFVGEAPVRPGEEAGVSHWGVVVDQWTAKSLSPF